jgi:O-antigen/teichoic acid export membrane protein
MNAQQILSGLGWSTFATAVSAACQLVFMAVLARLLDPAAFGLMAMAAIALRFAGYFAQLGFAQALIQRPRLEPADTAAALAMALALGTLMYLAMVIAAPLFAAAFRAPELAGLIDVLGLSLLLSPVASLPLALLRREARFKRVNAIEVAGYIMGYGGVGVACALNGSGVWSLVAATLGQQALVLVLGFMATHYPLAWPVPRAAFRQLWNFGTRYSLIGFLEFLAGNVETLIVGRLLGKAELGLFNRASTLTNLPVELGVTAVNKVLFPALSGLQHDRQRLADGFQILLLGVGLFGSALACGVAAGAPDVVALLLGAKWGGIVPLVEIVAFGVPMTFLYVACGVTLDSLAALGPKLRLQTALLAVKVALVLGCVRWGLAGVALAIVLTEALRLAAGLALVARLLALPLARLAGPLLLFAATGGAVWCAVAGAMATGLATGVPLAGRVAFETLAGGATLTATLVAIARRCPHYAPLQRFESLRRWHGRLMASVGTRPAST